MGTARRRTNPVLRPAEERDQQPAEGRRLRWRSGRPLAARTRRGLQAHHLHARVGPAAPERHPRHRSRETLEVVQQREHPRSSHLEAWQGHRLQDLPLRPASSDQPGRCERNQRQSRTGGCACLRRRYPRQSAHGAQDLLEHSLEATWQREPSVGRDQPVRVSNPIAHTYSPTVGDIRLSQIR